MAMTRSLGGGGGGGGAALTVKDEGTTLTTAASSIDIVGAGIEATNVGPAVTLSVAGGSGSPIAPSAIPDLYRWFKSDAGVTKDGADKVSAWNDQSGLSGGNAAQATGSQQPLWLANVLDGYPALRFTRASSQCLDLDLNSLAGSPATIVWVTGRRSNTNENYCLGSITSGVGGASLHTGWRNANQWTYAYWNDDLNLTIENYVAGRFHSVMGVCNTTFGRKIEAQEDPMLVATTGSLNTLGGMTGGGRIGGAVGQFFEGDIIEIVIFLRALSAVERSGLRSYLRGKYPSSLTTW
jgi:hypothetical protein